jgi:hypothetical protein
MAHGADTLQLQTSLSGPRYFLADRLVSGGSVLQLCFSGGWVTGRFEWSGDFAEPPRFHASIELAGGEVAMHAIDLPEGALLRWPES